MKILLMTDMEGSAGIVNMDDWVCPGGRYYEQGKRFVTAEVNAAVAGFFAGGASAVTVADGHGYGGLDIASLDSRAAYLRGPAGPYPFGLDLDCFDGTAWVGQHAKAGTPLAHIAHTGSHNVVDRRLNGISVGEFGEMAFLSLEWGSTPFFGSGDRAFCAEAEALFPGIYTAEVKRGLQPERGDECTTAEYERFALGAVHLAPARACELICEAAEKAAKALPHMKNSRPPALKAPFVLETVYRTDRRGVTFAERRVCNESLTALLNGRGE